MSIEVRADGRIVRTVTLAEQRQAQPLLADDNPKRERKPRTKRESRGLPSKAALQELYARMATAPRYVEPKKDTVSVTFIDPPMVHGPNGWYMPTKKDLNQWKEGLEND